MTAPNDGMLRIDAVTRTVPDLDVAARFYGEALGFVVDGPEIRASAVELALLGLDEGGMVRRSMRLGPQRIVFFRFTPESQPYPADSTSSDLWFQHCAIVVGDMASAHASVMRAGAMPITRGGPQRLPANTGGVMAFKFRDPFGHPLELLSLPDGVGDTAWHRDATILFEGIDHTAIAVSSLDTSRSFYTDILGFKVADRTRNRGKEQSRLDGIAGDDVDVVALAPRRAPMHLELLAYRTGRRRPLTDAAPTDAAVSRTVATGDIEALADRLTSANTPLRQGSWDGRSAIGFQDPDGHAWLCQALV